MIKPIYWHEGLFLRPQHFQQLDEYCHYSIQNRISMTTAYLWGINTISLVQAAIKNNIIDIAEMDLLLQDGTQIKYPGNCRISRRNIASVWDGSGKPVSIYLALRKMEVGSNNVKSESSTQYSTRYSVSEQGAEVADYYSNDKYHKLLFLDYEVQILVDSEIESAADYHVLKIAELSKFSGQTQLSNEYIPPVIRTSGSSCLVSLIRACFEQLVALIQRLKNNILHQHGNYSGRDDKQLRDLITLQSLNRYQPLLSECLYNSNSKPYDVYVVFRQFLMEMSTYSNNAKFEDIAADDSYRGFGYKHENLYAILSTICGDLSSIFDEIISVPEKIISLAYDGTFYTCDLNSASRGFERNIYLAVRTKLDEDKIVHVLECLSKVSSREQIPVLISRSISSVNLVHQSNPDYRLSREAGVYYFKFNQLGDAWKSIKKDNNIAIYLGAKIGQCVISVVFLDDKK